MGLIKAGVEAVKSVLADQWKEYFYCEALPVDVLVRRGSKRVGERSSNTKGSDNLISSGSVIAVADGQCMMIVEQGKVVELCAESGEYIFDSSTEPSIFAGDLGEGILETFKAVGRRFTFGGDTGKDQRVYYFNTKEILNNRFGTPSPIMFDVVNRNIGMSRTVQVRCNGIYSYTICDPMLFYTRVCGNVEYEYTRDQIDSQLKTEFISALQPALGALSELGLRPAQLPAKANELKKAMNDALQHEWVESRGIRVEKIAMNPITLTDEDMEKINQMEDAASLGSNPFMMAGRMTDANAKAMEAAAGNSAGAMTGFLGMGMAMNQMGGAAMDPQAMYNAGVQQAKAAPADGWTCACGAVNTGKFCPECGGKKPEAKAGWTCACGAVNTGKFCSECGAKKPEDDGWKCACGAVNSGKFCSECGAKKPQTKCEKCGWEVPAGSSPKFCPECGDPF